MERILSGREKWVDTICPYCLSKDKTILEIEDINDYDIYRIDGTIARVCQECHLKCIDIKHWRIRKGEWFKVGITTSQSDDKGE